MAKAVATSSNTRILLDDKPFASGGEGEVYQITSPASYAEYCVKLYTSRVQQSLFDQDIVRAGSDHVADQDAVCVAHVRAERDMPSFSAELSQDLTPSS